MKFILKYCFVILNIHYSIFSFSQQSKIDSLLFLLKIDKPDSNKVKHYNSLAWEFMYNDPDTSISIGKKALKLALKLNWKRGIANAYGNLGIYYTIKADYTKSLSYYLKALKLDEEMVKLASKNEIFASNRLFAQRLSNIGNLYTQQGNFKNAINYYARALKIDSTINYKLGMAGDLTNFGIVYAELGEINKSLHYFKRALKFNVELNDVRGTGICTGNMGQLYMTISENNDLTVKEKSIKLDSAKIYFERSLDIARNMGDLYGIAIWCGNLGLINTKLGNYNEAENFLFEAIKLDNEIGAIDETRRDEGFLSDLYELTNKPKLALEHYKIAMHLKDSIFNEEKNKEITKKEMSYEFEKKTAATKAKQDQKNAIAKEKLAQKEAERNYFIVGFILVLILALFILRGFRQKQKANILISKQKAEVELKNEIIEEKQKEILDSIRYARRIQVAQLPNSNYISKQFKRLGKQQ